MSTTANTTAQTLQAVQDAGEDFEWYPTTQRMIDVVKRRMVDTGSGSVLDIGAGDGRVLMALGRWKNDRGNEGYRKLYAIEKSAVLAQQWPEYITPVGSDLFEQNLACLKVDFIFSNPPYSQFETWVTAIIESGYAQAAFLVIPRRWKESARITDALKRRKATVKVIHSDDFHNAERRARAVVDIIEVRYPRSRYRDDEPLDPFDAWFDQNIDTFDHEAELDPDEVKDRDLARLRGLNTIGEMVDAFNEEYTRMEENYRAIFKLDYALLEELKVSKNAVRDGIKARMAGLKTKYWQVLFDRLDGITKRLSTDTKKKFVEKLTGQTAIAFTANNAYSVVLWAIKNANNYYNEQLVQLFRELATFDGVLKYKSNQRTWNRGEWRFKSREWVADREQLATHYALDYRIVLEGWRGIEKGYDGKARDGRLCESGYAIVADIIAVMHNLGFSSHGDHVRSRYWYGGQWQDFYSAQGDIIFQAKAYLNGNMHFRFMPEAIKTLNVEAGRLLGWLKNPQDVVDELGYSASDAASLFGSHRLISPSSVKLLAAS